MQILVKTYQGLEQVLAEELRTLGGTKVEVLHRAVRCEGDKRTLYRINYESRTALRVLVPIHTFKAKHENHFYKKVQEVNWLDYLNLKTTFAVNAVTKSKYMRHSKYLALKTKDAIVDQMRPHFDGQRPYIDTVNPDFRFNVHLGKDNVCSLSLDSSGDSLYKRGYRVASVEAPMSEVLAAGLVMLTGWTGETPFVDPMCGSGTIPIEAALIARRMPPQWKRQRFGFQSWRDFNAKLWSEVKSEAQAKVRPAPAPILGFDQDFDAFQVASKNLNNADLRDTVKVLWKKMSKIDHNFEEGTLVVNPPYDERLEEADIEDFYARMGDEFKQKFTGFDAWVISANRDAMKRVGLKASKKHIIFNGPLECRFQHYELYKGSRREEQEEGESEERLEK